MTDPADLLKGTTPGPWSSEESFDGSAIWAIPVHGGDEPLAEDVKPADARLMAAAPELARELVEARAEIDRLRNALWYACGTSNVRYLISLRWARDHPDASEARRAIGPKEAPP